MAYCEATLILSYSHSRFHVLTLAVRDRARLLSSFGKLQAWWSNGPFKSLLCNAPTADQSLTSGFPHNNRGKGLEFGSHCACAEFLTINSRDY